jgi:hypothetical protein
MLHPWHSLRVVQLLCLLGVSRCQGVSGTANIAGDPDADPSQSWIPRWDEKSVWPDICLALERVWKGLRRVSMVLGRLIYRRVEVFPRSWKLTHSKWCHLDGWTHTHHRWWNLQTSWLREDAEARGSSLRSATGWPASLNLVGAVSRRHIR